MKFLKSSPCREIYSSATSTTRLASRSISKIFPCGAMGNMGRSCSATRSPIFSGNLPLVASHISSASFKTSRLSIGSLLINFRATSSAGESSVMAGFVSSGFISGGAGVGVTSRSAIGWPSLLFHSENSRQALPAPALSSSRPAFSAVPLIPVRQRCRSCTP